MMSAARRTNRFLLAASMTRSTSSRVSRGRSLLTTPIPSGVTNNAAATAAAAELRHGPSDGIIKLNVGGKEFVTLRSTVDSNVVLSEYVARASQNGEYYEKGGAVFIDRDPAHFGLILTYLRNKMEGIAYNSRYEGKLKILNKHPKYLRMPKDDAVLQDLYVEAMHYQIAPLQKQLCEHTFLTMLFSYTGRNPFEQVNTFMKHMTRIGAVAVVGGTGSILATLNDEIDWLMGFHVKLPFRNEDDGREKKKALPAKKDGELQLSG